MLVFIGTMRCAMPIHNNVHDLQELLPCALAVSLGAVEKV